MELTARGAYVGERMPRGGNVEVKMNGIIEHFLDFDFSALVSKPSGVRTWARVMRIVS